MIVAGTLSERIGILKAEVVHSQFGSQEVKYTRSATVWAAVKYLKGDAVLTQGEVWLSKAISVTLRYTKAVGERDRLEWDGKTYRITSLNRSKQNGNVSITAEYIDEEN